jgi:flagellar biosynthesis chaperone FliJ
MTIITQKKKGKMDKTLNLLSKSKQERNQLAKGLRDIESVRQPVEAYLCYGGSLGFVEYMEKCKVPVNKFSRFTEYHNMCACGTDGYNDFAGFVEDELVTLNELHKQYSTKIFDLDERICNLEQHLLSNSDKSNNAKLEKNIRERKGNVGAWRKQLQLRIEKWKDDAAQRKALREKGKLPEKKYSNPVDEFVNLTDEEKTDGEVKSWIKRNVEVITVTATFFSLAAIFMIVGSRIKN